MSTKAKIITGYLVIGLLTAIYLSIWGASAYKGFAYNAGSGLVWPLVIFPGLGKIIGGIILVAIIGAIVLL
jgi:hypothetical protein